MPRKGQFQTYCKRGHERKPENLYPDRTCKQCACIRNPEKVARILAKQKANPEAHAARNRAWTRTESGRRSVRNTKLKKNYGLSPESFDTMFKEQDGRCKICGIKLDSSRKSLIPCVGHIHDETKRIRGLLCGDCNSGLGYFRDNTQSLKNAVVYLNAGAL